MPPHARGAHYMGDPGIEAMLKCLADHKTLANALFSALVAEDVYFTRGSCEKCGTSITVARGALGEWEERYYPPRRGKEG